MFELQELVTPAQVPTFDNNFSNRLEFRGTLPEGTSVFLIKRQTMVLAQAATEVLLVLYNGSAVFVRATDFALQSDAPRVLYAVPKVA